MSGIAYTSQPLGAAEETHPIQGPGPQWLHIGQCFEVNITVD